MDDIKNNINFMNVVVNTIPMALKSFERQKRDAFRNIIINTVRGLNPDEIKTQIFIRVLDSFTFAHIKALRVLDNPNFAHEFVEFITFTDMERVGGEES